MGFSKPTYAVDNITSLSDTPNATEGLTGAQLRARFDKTGADAKTYVNALVDELDISVALQNSGWVKDTTTTFSYTSATRMSTSVDLTAVIGVGDKIKYKQTIYKHGYVIAITATYIDVTSGSDYTVANEPITELYYSHESSPFGFPQWFNYTPTLQNISIGTGTNEAKFNIIGNQVNVYGRVAFGAGMSIGTVPTISLPTIPSITWGNNFNIMLSDTNVNIFQGLTGVSLDTIIIDYSRIVGNSIQTYPITASAPFTWVSGDAIYWKGSYIL